MTGGESMTELGAFTVLGFLFLLVALCSGAYWLAWRAGWIADPKPLPWEQSPGGRNDRARLLEDEVR